MRLGLNIGASDGPDGTITGLIKLAQDAEAKGFDNIWMANIFGLDAISTLGMIGLATSKIGLGTAVTPTYPRHPTAIAQQALTSGAASGGRFSLGIGLSHQVVIETMLGFSYKKPAKHMREYLSILGPLLKGETVSFQGEQYNINNIRLQVPEAKAVPLLVAALGPVMLDLAGQLADGTVTWMTGPKTLAGHIIPSLTKGAEKVGKTSPTVVAGFPMVLTNDADSAKQLIDKTLAIYGQLPSYRAMLDREGAAGPSDLAFAGNEVQLRKQLQELRDIGVTDFSAAIVAPDTETYTRTLDFLASEI